jgi:lipid A ethanolaminephosphotransferase
MFAPAYLARYTVTSGQLIVAASAFWPLGCVRAATWGFIAGLFVAMLALHVLLLGLVGTRRTLKPLLILLTLVGVFAMHYIQAYGVVIDPSMARNALRSDIAETRELLTWRLGLDLLLYAVLPIALLLPARIALRPWRRSLRERALLLLGAAGVFALAMLSQFQPLAALARNHKDMRYLVTPLNTVWSAGSVLAADARGAAKPRQAIGLDATPGPGWSTRDKPRLVMLVVGETARTANWGLSGYARQTTPQLAQLPLVNFSDVTACGTNTEVSLPCMFAPVGRRNYDEERIRGSESLLHVAARAGVAVQWRDNQSGCKGVCDGLPNDKVNATNAPGLCSSERCLDEGLLHGLEQRLGALHGTRSTQLLVLHMLGNHGPSYWRRYPAAFERFTPACRNDDLGQCSAQEIINAYDNALLYTDHVLASLIRLLGAHARSVDSAMLFVSDHGESLGEKGLFLHGVPYPIAQRVLHDGGRVLSGVALAACCVWALRGDARAMARRLRAAWIGVVLLCLVAVPGLKRVSQTSCPWDLEAFGGTAAYVPHWLLGVIDGGPGHCFPSGHAVAAFAFLPLYFQWRPTHPRRAWALLATTLGAGALFGWAQLARGAHFPSHTLWSAWLCWTIGAMASRWLGARDRVPAFGGAAASLVSS